MCSHRFGFLGGIFAFLPSFKSVFGAHIELLFKNSIIKNDIFIFAVESYIMKNGEFVISFEIL